MEWCDIKLTDDETILKDAFWVDLQRDTSKIHQNPRKVPEMRKIIVFNHFKLGLGKRSNGSKSRLMVGLMATFWGAHGGAHGGF